MRKTVIYGAGAYAKVFFHEVDRHGGMDIVGFTVDSMYLKGKDRMYGLPIVPFEEVRKIYPETTYDMIVLCGYSIMRKRKEMYEKAKRAGYQLCNYISPGAFLERDIEMGENNIIMSNSTIGYDGKMGNGNIIRQNVYLGHEFVLGNHIIISPGCSLGGCSRIEDLVFLGIGTTSRSYITFGAESLVGVGSNVTKNIPSCSVCYGNPAKMIKQNQKTGVVVEEIDHE